MAESTDTITQSLAPGTRQAQNTPDPALSSREAMTNPYRVVDNYEVHEDVGHGGMASVYRARDTRLDRTVAIKILHDHIASRAENRDRFEREAQAVARLEHPNIVRIYGFSSPQAPVQYIATEFIDGPTLREFVDNVGFKVPETALFLAHRLALALKHAHDSGVIHRDIKPENIMVTPQGVPKLMDFGLARVLDADKLTQTGSILGSPAHMSPEIIEGAPVDHRSDLFAFGTVLYFCVTGKLPFDGRNPAVILNAILGGDYAHASMVNPMVSDRVSDIIDKCLKTNPDDRFATTDDLVEALDAAIREAGVDDSERELRAFFDAPDAYERELKSHLIAHWNARAVEAANQGKIAAAMRFADRVLALSPSNASATHLVERVRSQHRIRRAIAASVITLCVVGAIVIISSVLTSPSSELHTLDAPAVVASSVTERDETTRATLEHAEMLAAVTSLAAIATAETVETQRRAIDAARGVASEARTLADLQNQRRSVRIAQRVLDTATPPARARIVIPTAVEPDDDGAHENSETALLDTQPEAEPHTVDCRFHIFPPSANVIINDQRFGQAAELPDRIPLTPGTHRLIANIEGLPNARIERTFEVRDREGQTFRYQVPWPDAVLRVESRRPGTVFIDEEPVGATNEAIAVRILGSDRQRDVRVRAVPLGARGGVLFERAVELTAGSERVIEASF